MKLGDLGTFKTGGTPSRSKNEYWGDKYPWISSTALGDVYIDENAATDWISDEGLKNSSTKLIKANSLMIGIRIGVGKCSINRIPMCTSQDVVSIEGIDTERYYLPYITTLINNKRHYLESLKRGATIQGITTDIIKNLQIPDIQINRQKLIADTIQVVDDMVCLSHKQLAKLDTLVKSRFIEMFGDPVINDKGWPKDKLKKHADVIVGYPFASSQYTADGLPIVGGYNLMQGFVQWENSKFWPSPEGYEQYLLKDEDIVIAMDRPWVGNGFKIATIPKADLPAILIQRTACIRCKDIYTQFLYRLLDSEWFADHCQITGSLVPHISNKDILSYEIIVPPIDLQKQFADFVALTDKSKLVLQQLIEKQELLRSALMQEYFG